MSLGTGLGSRFLLDHGYPGIPGLPRYPENRMIEDLDEGQGLKPDVEYGVRLRATGLWWMAGKSSGLPKLDERLACSSSSPRGLEGAPLNQQVIEACRSEMSAFGRWLHRCYIEGEMNEQFDGDRRPALRPKVQRVKPSLRSQAEAVTRDPRNDQKGSASVQAEAMSVPNGFMGFMKSAA